MEKCSNCDNLQKKLNLVYSSIRIELVKHFYIKTKLIEHLIRSHN